MSDELAAWIKGVLAAAIGMIAWFANKLYERFESHEERIKALEVTVPALATKEDILEVREEVSGKIDTLRESMSEQHAAILAALVKDQR